MKRYHYVNRVTKMTPICQTHIKDSFSRFNVKYYQIKWYRKWLCKTPCSNKSVHHSALISLSRGLVRQSCCSCLQLRSGAETEEASEVTGLDGELEVEQLLSSIERIGGTTFLTLILRLKFFWTLSFSSGLGIALFNCPSHSRSTSPPCLAMAVLTREAKSVDDSFSCLVMGGRYHTSHTMAQLVIIRKTYVKKSNRWEFQKGSPKMGSYLMATG